MTYNIYHPVGGALNIQCKPESLMYKKVFVLEAENLENAFILSQNDLNEAYASKGIRSTSVGDIIQPEDDVNVRVCHLVCGIGFQEKECINSGIHLFFQ